MSAGLHFAENSLTYSITSGNVGSAFEVVPDLGEIKVRCHLDYETGPRVYKFKRFLLVLWFSQQELIMIACKL